MGETADYKQPVKDAEPSQVLPEDGVALCLSGGGYRAMLFHIGALWRLHETGTLRSVKQISSVSGGSITAGKLALSWNTLMSSDWDRDVFQREIVTPLRSLADKTIDSPSVLLGILLPGGVGRHVANAYDKRLLHNATLQELPDAPVFVINSTNVQSGALWRFRKDYMRDYKVGEVQKPGIPLSYAVAASSAFPPFLSPFTLKLGENQFTPGSGDTLQRKPFTTNAILTDGGVYDNLGLEPAWKQYKTILVSDGGGKMGPQARPWLNWAFHSRRVLDLVDNQVRALRKRQLMGSFQAEDGDATHRSGAYWGIRTNISKYSLHDTLPCPCDRTLALAEIPTRLGRMPSLQQERLINWGYAVTDAALRRHVNSSLSAAIAFPFPNATV
ncbi:MAG: patatin-like phospholipase family protein [Rhizobiaceae bacterium]|nr:patatin-like phospholipase family protein [Rhizobiaceae bacterium]